MPSAAEDRLDAFLLRRGGAWTRGDWLVAVGLLLAVLVRWGDRARYLMTWDAHTFALAAERYDINGLRPHAPGYPIYVALGRFMRWSVGGDANDGYILLSIVFAGLGLVATYALGRALANRAVGLAAAFLVLCAPLLHVHAMTANVYSADLGASAVVAWTAWRARQQATPTRIAMLALAFAAAVGIRPSLVMFLAPLALWGALQPPWRDLRLQARRLVPGAVAGVVGGLAWALPMLWASDGYATWKRANDLQGGQVVFSDAVWNRPAMLQVNVDRLHEYLQWEVRYVLPVAAVAIVALLVHAVRDGGWQGIRRCAGATNWRLGVFLALWGLPPLLFYLLVYSGYGHGPSGYALLLLPPLALAVSLLLARLVRSFGRAGLAVASAMLLLSGAGLAAHSHDVNDMDYREHDAWVASWMGLRDVFPPTNTSIVASWSFAHVWYYYPDYAVYNYRPAGRTVGEVPDFLFIQEARRHEAVPDWYDEIADRTTPVHHPLDAGIETLILFDFQLAGENGGERQLKPDVPVHEFILPNGWRILHVQTTPDRPLLEDYFTLDGAATGHDGDAA